MTAIEQSSDSGDLVPATPSPDVAQDPHSGHTGVPNAKLAMWLFLSSGCLFFGAFIATYLLYRDRNVNGPYQDELYDIPFTSVSSFVLLMSSLTMVLALSAIQKGDLRKMRVWLIATALLGLTFLSGQAFEFTEFWEQPQKFGLEMGLFAAGLVVAAILAVRTPTHQKAALQKEAAARQR